MLRFIRTTHKLRYANHLSDSPAPIGAERDGLRRAWRCRRGSKTQYRNRSRCRMDAVLSIMLGAVCACVSADTITGTAFFVSPDGYAITCAHVVKDATSIELVSGDKSAKAAVIATDDKNDLALLKVEEINKPTLVIGNAGKVEPGSRAWVLGYPLTSVLGDSVKVSSGTVSGITVQGTQRLIQIDAAVNAGNSGAPLLNDRGEVIGVVNAKIVRADVSGVGFAVPANYALQLLRNEGVVLSSASPGAVMDGQSITRSASPAVVLVKATVPLKEPVLVKSLPAGPCDSASFSKSGKSLICSGNTANRATIWDVEKRTAVQSFAGVAREDFKPEAVDGILEEILKHPIVDGAALSPDERLAAVHSSPLLLIYDMETGKRNRSLWMPALFGAPFAFSPDGKWLLYGKGTLCGEIECLNLSTGQTSRIGSKSCSGFSVSPCSKLVAVCFGSDAQAPHAKGSVEIVEMPKGSLTRRITGSRAEISEVCYSPDGRYIAGSESDATVVTRDAIQLPPGIVTIWDSDSGSVAKLIQCPGMSPSSLRYSPDGKLIAVTLGEASKVQPAEPPKEVSGSITRVGLYDVATGERVALLPGWLGFQNSAQVFSPDGKFLAVLGDAVVSIWQVK